MVKIGIWGWWQGRNFGDNLILRNMLKIFPEGKPVTSDITDFSEYDFMVCGGGGLFSDRITPPWNKDVIIPFGFFGIGAEFMAPTHLLDKAKFMYIRDEHTRELMGGGNVTADSIFYDPVGPQKKGDNIIFVPFSNFDKLYNHNPVWPRYIGNVKPWSAWEDVIDIFGSRVVAYHGKDGEDVDKTLNSFNNAKLVVSARYHGVLLAIQRRIPVIAIDITPKIKAVMKALGLEDYCLRLGETDRFTEAYNSAMQNKESIKEKMAIFTESKSKMVKDAAKNAQDILRCIL